MEQEYLLLMGDSFFAGVFLTSNGEVILPTMLSYADNYDIPLAFLIAFLANSAALILSFLAARLLIHLVEEYSLIGYKIKKHQLSLNKNFCTRYLWMCIFLAPLSAYGALIVIVSGVLKSSYQKIILIILAMNLTYYIAFYLQSQQEFIITLIAITTALAIKNYFDLRRLSRMKIC